MRERTKENRKMSTKHFFAVSLILAITVIIFIAGILFAEKLEETSYAATVSLEDNDSIIEDQTVKHIVYNPTVQENNIENIADNSNISSNIQNDELDINELIKNNTQNIPKEEIVKKEIDLEYTTKYTDNPDLPKGMLQVIQEGIDGKQEIYIKKTYAGEELVKEEQIGSKVTKSSVNKMVAIGTGSYTSNYTIKIGDTLYVTSSILAVRIEPNNQANKLITLNKNTQVKLLQKKDEWYQIQYQSYIGWSKAECFTYLNPNANKENNNTTTSKYTKQQLLNKLSFNMNLNSPSGLSLEQFKKIFENEPKDTQKIFKNNAQYFYYAEKQYGINGVFLAAVAIHESGWGGSSIANNKNNLFGYGAYDRSPYSSAYQFSDYSEGIDLLGRVFVKYYLYPAGTKIYDGNVALGTYYNGPTLSGVNVRYATDKNWANGVYNWMKYLYNKI